MRTTEILERLKKANFSDEQASQISDILEGRKEEQVTREYLSNVFKSMSLDLDNAIRSMGLEMKDNLNQIIHRFDTIDRKFEKIDARFEQVDARFEKVDAKVETLNEGLLKEITQSKYDLLRWIFGLLIAHGAFLTALNYFG